MPIGIEQTDVDKFNKACKLAGVSLYDGDWKVYMTFALVFKHLEQNGSLDDFNLRDAARIEVDVEKGLDGLMKEDGEAS